MRYPAVAGRFYPIEKEELLSTIEMCFEHELGPGLPNKAGNKRSICAAVSPHAGYMASGMNAAHTFKRISEDGLPEAYIIVGPDHYGVPYGAVMCSDEFLTPLGSCRIHDEIAGRLRQFIPDDCNAHRFEHSIEVQIPFIQYIDPDPHIIPIIMGRQDRGSAAKLSSIIKDACKDRDVIVIASSDMAHYVPKQIGERMNRAVLERLKERDINGMYSIIEKERISVCGYGPMAVAIMSTDSSEVEILKYSDSWDSLRYDKDSVVGYGSAVMYK
jgi:Predicted dioxygenase